jgi:hypothetical protein
MVSFLKLGHMLQIHLISEASINTNLSRTVRQRLANSLRMNADCEQL